MGNMTKLEKQILGAMLALQLVLMLASKGLIAALLPPLLAAVPAGYATLRSQQTIRMMAPKLRRAYVGIFVLFLAVGASFIFASEDLSFKLRFLRALLADVAILWLAAIVAVHLHIRGKPMAS